MATTMNRHNGNIRYRSFIPITQLLKTQTNWIFSLVGLIGVDQILCRDRVCWTLARSYYYIIRLRKGIRFTWSTIEGDNVELLILYLTILINQNISDCLLQFMLCLKNIIIHEYIHANMCRKKHFKKLRTSCTHRTNLEYFNNINKLF